MGLERTLSALSGGRVTDPQLRELAQCGTAADGLLWMWAGLLWSVWASVVGWLDQELHESGVL